MQLAPKTRLGPYEIVSPLGVGGMGVVYRAIDTRLGRHVAIKLLPEHLSQDARSLERFEREARALGAIAHPNILSIFEFDVEGSIPFVVMELLEGETLSTRIRRGALPWREVVEIAIHVAEGLSAAHEKGIVHRDLKPENVFLTTDGRVKILDFGIARSTAPAIIADDEKTTPQTAPGVVIGTLGYIAPEQLRGKHADAKSDIFSLGCVMYEMITGQRAFAGESGVDALAAILRDDPPEIGERHQVPAQLESAVSRALEKDRDRRYGSARELIEDLRLILTTQQMRRTSLVLTVSAIASIVFAIAAVVAARRPLGPPLPAAERINSIAVLPFENLAKSSETEYLSDGLSESLINSLSRFPNLRVIARTTAFRYKGKKRDPEAIAGELQVEALVTGKVVTVGDRLVIQADLLDVRDRAQLWGDRYDAHAEDVLAIQEEIARQIARNLRLRLRPSDEEEVVRHQTKNREAYELYLRGRHHWNRRTEEGYAKAIELFQEAIGHDPSYALAYSGIADCYVLSYALRESETMSRAKAAAMKALELDEELPEAHASLGHVKHYWEWDWLGASDEFQRALELNPNYLTARHWYGRHLVQTGRIPQGMREMRRALDLDPLSLSINTDYAYCLYLSRRYDEAIEFYRKTAELDANFVRVHHYLAWAYRMKGRYDEGIAAAQEAIRRGGRSAESVAALGHLFALAGRKREAEAIRAELETNAKRDYVAPLFLMQLYIGLGDRSALLRAAENARANGEHSSLLDVLVDPIFDPYRSDAAIMKVMPKLPGAR